jgi:hypothetical protein
MEDPAKQREQVIRLITAAEVEAKKLEALGRGITECARLAQDVARPMKEIWQQVETGRVGAEEWTRQIGAWNSWHETMSGLQAMQPAVGNFVAVTQGVTNTSVSGISAVFIVGPGSPAPPAAAETARRTLFRRLEQLPLAVEAIASMRRLGLDSRGGNANTPVQLLEEARGALERPVAGEGGPVSVLISLRESIDAVITELIRRRPAQGKVKGWKGKVTDIGGQCGRLGLRPELRQARR